MVEAETYHQSSWLFLFTVTILIFANIVMLYYAQYMTSFTVYYAVVAPPPLEGLSQSAQVLSVNLWVSIRKLYDQNLKVVAFVLLVLSGVWPYFKLFAMLMLR